MSADVRISFRGFLAQTTTFGRATARFGQTGMPDELFRLTNGTGSGQCDTVFVKALSIAATTTLQVDFKSGETDLLGNAVNLQSVKLVAVVVTTASATLWVGPQNLTNACQLWFGGVAATDKNKVTDRFWNSDEGGWAVGGSTKILGINNPGGSTVSGYLICAGVAA